MGAGRVHWAHVRVEHPASNATGLSRVLSQFRFASYPTEECLELEAGYLSNIGGSRDVLNCRVIVSRPGLDVGQGLRLANELNGLGWTNADFCVSDKSLIVSKRSAVEQPTGARWISDESPFTGSPFALFFAAVLATALASLRLVPQEVAICAGQRLWSADPLSKSCHAFGCWVMLRLIRWEAATLKLNSPAFNVVVVVDAGAVCLALVIRDASESRHYGWTETEEQDLRRACLNGALIHRSRRPKTAGCLTWCFTTWITYAGGHYATRYPAVHALRRRCISAYLPNRSKKTPRCGRGWFWRTTTRRLSPATVSISMQIKY